MADTTFTNGVTLTDEDWFNDVNDFYYGVFRDAGTLVSAQSAFYSATVAAAAMFTNVTQLNVAGTLSVSAGVAGAAVATQANMESAISSGSVALIVTPGRLQYHPGVAKAFVRFDGSATSVTAAAGAYNISSITDKGTGNYNIIFTTAFSANSFAPMVSGNLYNMKLTSISSASVEVTCVDLSGTAADATIVTLIAFGDQ